MQCGKLGLSGLVMIRTVPTRVRLQLHRGVINRRILCLVIFCVISTYTFRDVIFRTLMCEEGGRHHGRKLIQIQLLFRHGHRAPFYMYKNDPIPESYWIEGLNRLTMHGRVQHYMVGLHLREKYKDFLTFQPKEVYCLSSGSGRCVVGCYSLLAGMYPPTLNRRIDEKVAWQPIPVEYNPEDTDRYLPSINNCPIAEFEKKQAIVRPEGAAHIAKKKHLYEYWTKFSGKNVTDYDVAGGLYKTLLIQKTLNLTIPEWAEHTWEELRFEADIAYYFNFQSDITQRLRAGPLLELILNKMKVKMTNPEDSRKVHLFSGHGTNVAAVLQSLRLFNMKMPPFTSFVTLELYKEGNSAVQQYTVRMLYTNGSNPAIHIPPHNVLVLPGCTEYCPFEFFEKYTSHLILENYEEECGQDAPINYIENKKKPKKTKVVV